MLEKEKNWSSLIAFQEETMQVTKNANSWTVVVEPSDNSLGLVNLIRSLENMNDQLDAQPIENLAFALDLENLRHANSELIALFVMVQSNLVRTNGRLSIINANLDLKGAFDVVMLDKIISIQYFGYEEGEDFGYEE